ncbi:hypothetical protein [Shewanella algae]|uniref:hypothetical protein n=1 Tax=Shewanella algae TaxID=38313 RepID=UPI0031F4EE83
MYDLAPRDENDNVLCQGDHCGGEKIAEFDSENYGKLCEDCYQELVDGAIRD